MKASAPPQKKILVINPNSTEAMTHGLQKMLHDSGYDVVSLFSLPPLSFAFPSSPFPLRPSPSPFPLHPKRIMLNCQRHDIEFATSKNGPPSINSDSDAELSAQHFSNQITSPHDEFLKPYAGVLIACYSVHPLVSMLRTPALFGHHNTPVVGIFEASVSLALSVLGPGQRFGIVSTGKVWEASLTRGVEDLLGSQRGGAGSRFKGVETTGLSATELHTVGRAEVEARMKEATKRLVRDGDVGAVCLGCAGMAGMDVMVREACVEVLGEEEGRKVRIVDGIKAGMAILDGLTR